MSVPPDSSETNGANAQAAPATASRSVPLRWTYAILILAFLFVLMPFLFWQSTWFGKPLTDAEITKNLADAAHPRKIQHALAQIADRMLSPQAEVRQSARQWYPQIVGLAAHRIEEIRLTAAWVMGQDNSVPDFHAKLLDLLRDAHPMVRRNAALGLVRFQDAAGLQEVRAMLKPYTVLAPRAGVLDQRLKPGDVVNPGTLLGRIQPGGEEVEIRAQVPGTVERWLVNEGTTVKEADALLTLSPSAEAAWEALRALLLVGTAEDLPDVERYSRGVPDMPSPVRVQAELTARSIRSRGAAAR